jgi:hypothetical protein
LSAGSTLTVLTIDQLKQAGITEPPDTINMMIQRHEMRPAGPTTRDREVMKQADTELRQRNLLYVRKQ